MPRETGTRMGGSPPTGDPHPGEDLAENPPLEGKATQGTHTKHTQTYSTRRNSYSKLAQVHKQVEFKGALQRVNRRFVFTFRLR